MMLIFPLDQAKEVTKSARFSNPKQLKIANINVKHDDILYSKADLLEKTQTL